MARSVAYSPRPRARDQPQPAGPQSPRTRRLIARMNAKSAINAHDAEVDPDRPHADRRFLGGFRVRAGSAGVLRSGSSAEALRGWELSAASTAWRWSMNTLRLPYARPQAMEWNEPNDAAKSPSAAYSSASSQYSRFSFGNQRSSCWTIGIASGGSLAALGGRESTGLIHACLIDKANRLRVRVGAVRNREQRKDVLVLVQLLLLGAAPIFALDRLP